MRILVLSFYYAPDLCAGSFRTTAFVEELKKQISSNDKIEIITAMPNRYGSFNEDAKEFEKFADNIEINRIDLGSHKSGFVDQSKLFLKFAWQVMKLVRTIFPVKTLVNLRKHLIIVSSGLKKWLP